MGFQCGIVGLPNVGKSTLFNALTKAAVAAENYPYCTIDPHVGIVPIDDKRLEQLAAIVNPQRILPTTMQFVDIAGLIAGASKGEGLGNKFLANIRETDAITHVVRCFEDDDIVHVDGKINPQDDIQTIDTELALADLETVEKAITRISKQAKSGNKEKLAQLKVIESLQQHLDQGYPVRTLDLDDQQKLMIQELHLLTNKPTMYIANVAEDGMVDNPYLDQVKQIADQENAVVVPICASIEAEIAQLEADEKQEFLDDLGLEQPGLTRVVMAGYRLLGLHTYFTAGVKEVRAWTLPIGSTAPQAAGIIHTDFERGFIRAETISFDDYIQHNGEQGAKESGRMRLEGKDYIVNDGDVIHFRFNV